MKTNKLNNNEKNDSMQKILAIDCSSSYMHLYLKDCSNEYFESRNIGLKHSERLLPLIDLLLGEAGLKPADLDLIACTRGPGSFTGLRIAMATAKGIAAATGVPLVSVLTPDYLAKGTPNTGIVIPVIDAKKKRYYSRLYRAGSPITEALDISPEDLVTLTTTQSKANETLFITGPDAPLAMQEINDEVLRLNADMPDDEKIVLNLQMDPMYDATRIRFLAQLAEEQFTSIGADAEGAGPLYIRKSEAELCLK